MTFDEFHKKLNELNVTLSDEIFKETTLKVEAAAMKFVDDNFARQGWEGNPWKESTGTILVKSGDLRSGFRSQLGYGEVRIYNEVPYAKIHNEGFRGVQYVKPHSRGRHAKAGKGLRLKTGGSQVKGFARRMNMPRRQFAPYLGHESSTLNALVDGVIDQHVTDLLKKMQNE